MVKMAIHVMQADAAIHLLCGAGSWYNIIFDQTGHANIWLMGCNVVSSVYLTITNQLYLKAL